MKYSFLEPIQLGGYTLRNRVIYSAQGKKLADDEGFIDDRYIAYYRNIAAGGCALVTPEIMVLDEDWPYKSVFEPHFSSDKYIPQWKKLVDAVHAEGALIALQMWHPGEYGSPDAKSINDFTLEEIRRIQKLFVEGAVRAKKTGADGVELHLAHLYLLSQVMSPAFNHRTDEYGADTIENALRFSTEIMDGIVEACCKEGEPFLLNVKINGNDFVKGGTTPEWAAAAAPILEAHGATLITVNGGGLPSLQRGFSHGCFQSGQEMEGWKVDYAKLVRENCGIPVAANDTIRHPDFADQIIRDGKCDIVCIGRGLVAEPEWPKKCAEGREDELRICVNCLHCLNMLDEKYHGPGKPGCTVNPWSRDESNKPQLVKNGGGRTVAIVGAGPGGMEAAVTLAQRGFRPVVFEKGGAIGGAVLLAELPPFKKRLHALPDYHERQAKRLGIDVRFHTEATEERVRALDPAAVIVSTGTREWAPPIPGVKEHTVSVRQALEEPVALTHGKVIVLGGGDTGIETAHLYQLRRNQVTVIEMLDENPNPTYLRMTEMMDVRQSGVDLRFSTRIDSIEAGVVHTTHTKTGEKTDFEADLIICSLGRRPVTELYDQLSASLDVPVYKIGDCANPAPIVDAMRAGSELGYSLLRD